MTYSIVCAAEPVKSEKLIRTVYPDWSTSTFTILSSYRVEFDQKCIWGLPIAIILNTTNTV